jgi:hypothetical protein
MNSCSEGRTTRGGHLQATVVTIKAMHIGQKLCALTAKIRYCHLPLHRATTTAVQTAAPVPEIMNAPSYFPLDQEMALASLAMIQTKFISRVRTPSNVV